MNRCNLPASILGGLSFQQSPSPLYLDSVRELHSQIFESLAAIDAADTRATHFQDYMSSSFLLDHREEAGFDAERKRFSRGKANYLRLLRGWMFSSDGTEGAVLKRWVESRFGLLARSHRGPLRSFSSENYEAYQREYLLGLYNANALESQLDLLYSFCQYELARRYPGKYLCSLFRGLNHIDEHEVIEKRSSREYILLLNNLNSFTGDREQSDSFGDYIVRAQVPVPKLVYFPGLLPGVLKGEDEYLVLGGVYDVELSWI